MDVSRLSGDLPRLLEHMGSAGYCARYVHDTETVANWVTESSDGWECWDDARGALGERWGEGTPRSAAMGCVLTIVQRFCEEGVLPRTDGHRMRSKASARDTLCAGLLGVIEAYEASPEAAAKKESSVRGDVSTASCFLARLQALGRTSVAEVTEDDVIEVLTDEDGGPAYSAATVRKARAVLLAARAVEGCERVASLMPIPREWAKAGDALTSSERDAVAEAIADPDSDISPRDRAIVALMLHTGMRACDVAGLTMDAIDWERDLIGIVQQKTGAPLELPLLPQVGNAIYDYVTGERGMSRDRHVFLSEDWPYGRLTANAMRHSANAAFDAAGVRCGGGDGRGTHLFRRGLASAMMGNGADRSVVASALGHASPRTAERYMVADVEGLRRRSLDVSPFPVAEGVFA